MAASAATWRARRHPLRRAGCATRPVLRESWRREPLTNERRAGRRQRHRDVKTHGWRSRSACKEWPSHAAAQRCNARTASACAANRDRFATGSHRWHLAGLCLQALVQVAWAVPAAASTAGTKRQHLKQKKKTESPRGGRQEKDPMLRHQRMPAARLHSRPPCQHGLELLDWRTTSRSPRPLREQRCSHRQPCQRGESHTLLRFLRERASTEAERAAADRRVQHRHTGRRKRVAPDAEGWRPSRR